MELAKSNCRYGIARGLFALGLFLLSGVVQANVGLGNNIVKYYTDGTQALAACNAAPAYPPVSVINHCVYGYPGSLAPLAGYTTCFVVDGTSSGDWKCDRYMIQPSCPTGESLSENQGCVSTTADDTCEVGTRKTFTNHQSSNPADLKTSLCGSDGCRYELDSNSMSFGMPALGRSSGQYIATHTTCTVAIDAPTEETVLPGKQCAEDGYGNKICLEPAETNCGEFNGAEICAEDIPTDGACHLLGSGGFICDGDTPPDNLDGTSQHEVAEVTNGADDAQVYDAAGGADAQGTAQGNEDTGIDETGTPTGSDDMFGDDFDALDGGFTDGIGNEGEGGGVASGAMLDGIVPDLGIPSSGGSCTSSTFTFAGFTFDFPGTRGCTYLANFKLIAGWMIYAYTVFALFDVITIGMRSKI